MSRAIDRRSDIVVARPIPRETIREVERGVLVTCTANYCDWQGLFPNGHLAKEAVETHYDRQGDGGDLWHTHQGTRTYTIVRLLDEATAQTVDESALGLTVEENRLRSVDGSVREVEFPRTLDDVSDLVGRGVRIRLPYGEEQKVVSVTEGRSHGLPTWSVRFCDLEDDLDSGRLPPRFANELVARDDQIYYSFGEDPLASPAFEVVGEAEHQADLDRFTGGASA